MSKPTVFCCLISGFILMLMMPAAAWGQSTSNEKNQQGSTKKSNGSANKSETEKGSASKTNEGWAERTDGPSDVETETEKVDEAFQRFTNAVEELRRNELGINQLFATMPIGFADKTERFKQQIERLRERNRLLSQSLLPNAVASYESHPLKNEIVTKFLIEHMRSQITGDRFPSIAFDPVEAMASYQRLADGGLDTAPFRMFEYRINYLLNEYEAARLAVLKAHQMHGQQTGQPLPNGTAVMDDLREITALWKRELEFREADKNSGVPQVKLETTVGDIVLELFEDQAPNTVANFVSLVESGFYDGLDFYQVGVQNFVIAGSSTEDGLGGPGYVIDDECDREDARHHFTGVISMYPARKDGGGSRFLITKKNQQQLNGKNTVFGRVTEGLEYIFKIQVVDLTRGDSRTPTKINKATVLRKRDHPYEPVKSSGSGGLSEFGLDNN